MKGPGSAIDRVPETVRKLYAIVSELEGLFPGRHFTPDGHLVGSLGEVWAAFLYGIELSGASSAGHDGRAPDGRLVQIKATQGRSVGLRSQPDHLIVLQLDGTGRAAEVYNGPGKAPWDAAGPTQSNGQRFIGVKALRGLMKDVPPDLRLRQRAGQQAAAADERRARGRGAR